VFVSRQLGPSSPTITLDVYPHLFEQADHAVAAREALEASHVAMVGTTGLGVVFISRQPDEKREAL